MNHSIRDYRRNRIASAVVALSMLTGCSVTATEASPLRTVTTVPSSPTASWMASPTASGPANPRPSARAGQVLPNATKAPQLPVMPASTPVALRIPALGTESRLLSLGLRGDGSLEVPPEGPGSPAAWYNGSPTPGARGPAVLFGHVNATGGGPGVFAELRRLKAGDTIEVSRQDGRTATFLFDRGERYPKNSFPTYAVYGNTQGAELRLITCDGYDPATGEFDDNYVVYAKLVP
ncbi:class F sortase [Arthrobacter globiformis]|uniref:class F sortase n=1 Tax=Arthrobacter globiformis TaxID=1665 RepID=UPI0027D81A8F|nr:class F sortase [Arthrobacter globiformis]